MWNRCCASADQPRRIVAKLGKATPWRSAASEAGDTLIEVLIALTVIGLTATALLGAFTTSISASAQHRNLASLDTVLKSFVETATYQLGQQSSTDPKFTACATPTTYESLTLTQGTNPIYSASITEVQYWQSDNTWGSSCSAGTLPPQQQLLTATATNESNNVNESIQFAVSNPVYAPAPASAPMFSGTFSDTVVAGTDNTYPVYAMGTPTPSLSVSGEPSWVSLVDDGAGNGTLVIDPPSTGASGNTYSFVVSAMNGYQGGSTVTQTFQVSVSAAPVFTSANNDTVPPDTAFSFPVAASGLPTPTLSASGLPGWASFTDNGDGSGTLSATNPVTGSYTITLGALNTAGSAAQTFTLVVSAATPPAFTSAANYTAPYGGSAAFSITTTGAPTAAITESGTLPAGVNFTPGSGSATLSGSSTASGTYPLTFTATNLGGTVTQSFTLTVNAQSQPTISTPTNASPATVKKNGTRSFDVTGTGFVSGLTVTVSSNGGVPGMTNVNVTFLSSGSITVTGLTPNSTGSYSFTITNPDGGTVDSMPNALKVIP